MAIIYAATSAAQLRLAQELEANREHLRIVLGTDVLGVFIHHIPRGWPNQTEGRVTRIGAPRNIINSAIGKIPEKATRLYPFPEEPGIEVFGDVRYDNEMYYMSYTRMEKVILQKNTVCVTFTKSRFGITELGVITVTDNLAARLSASFGRKTSRRLVVNSEVVGIYVKLGNGSFMRMGNSYLDS